MKIAFVNQPIDVILPPNQSSVGACTYWVARPLAQTEQVLVYGLQDNHGDPAAAAAELGIDFRFFPASKFDKALFKLQRKTAKLLRRTTPISSSKWLYPDYGKQVALDLKEQNCDIIHLQHCSQYAPIIRTYNPHAKIVLHLHAQWFSQCNPTEITQRLAAVDMVTTVGDSVTEKTKRDFPVIADRCETSYNGIDPEEFPWEKDYHAARRRRVKRILYSGAVSPQKGLHVLIDAFVLVARKYPNVALDIVGPIGNYPIEESFDLKDRDAIKRVAPFYKTSLWSLFKSRLEPKTPRKSEYLKYLESRLPPDIADKVSFRGMFQRPRLVDHYYDADIFAFTPVWEEGFGLPPIEAMAAGLPVVTSRSGTLVETVVDGKTGIVVEKDNAEELAQALLSLLADDNRREEMGRQGRLRALRDFNWKAIAAQMYQRYQGLMRPL